MVCSLVSAGTGEDSILLLFVALLSCTCGCFAFPNVLCHQRRVHELLCRCECVHWHRHLLHHNDEKCLEAQLETYFWCWRPNVTRETIVIHLQTVANALLALCNCTFTRSKIILVLKLTMINRLKLSWKATQLRIAFISQTALTHLQCLLARCRVKTWSSCMVWKNRTPMSSHFNLCSFLTWKYLHLFACMQINVCST